MGWGNGAEPRIILSRFYAPVKPIMLFDMGGPQGAPMRW